MVARELLEEIGHLRTERVLHLARERFYWPGMKRDIEHFVTHVCRCIKQKRPHILPKAPMEIIQGSTPFELVSLDFAHLKQSRGGYEYILVIVDYFTRFTQAYATSNNSERQQLTSCAMTLYWGLGSVPEFCTTKGVNLRISFPSFRRMPWYGAIQNNTLPPLREWENKAAQPDTPIHVAHLARTPEMSVEREPE